MLAVSPLNSTNDGNNNYNNRHHNHHSCEETKTDNFTIGAPGDEFPDFGGGNLLDSIDFDDLFIGMHDGAGVGIDVDRGDMLPDLEMDPELLAEFSLSGTGEDDNSSGSSADIINNTTIHTHNDTTCRNVEEQVVLVGEEKKTAQVCDKKNGGGDEEIESNKKLDGRELSQSSTMVNSSFKEGQKGKKSQSSSKSGSNNSSTNNNNNNNNQGKRKAKVDWTPELHRRFVQAVEQLGVDKAVPSRILELMGIDCLTRHNIASHLQKYRSHRKHLLAREAEAANWSQKRQMYGVAGGGGKGGGNSISTWHPPIMGFPPMTTMHHHPAAAFRPLHVWGHPTMDLQSRMPMWPKQVVPTPSPPPPPAWTPPPPHHPTVDPSFWHSPHHRRFTAPPVPGIPPHAMYRPEHAVAQAQSGFEVHPSKESLDSAIGDVLAKPWLPLPIGLKPPSVDSVLVELQRQGVPKIPPASCA